MINLSAALDQTEACIATGLSHVRKHCDQDGKMIVVHARQLPAGHF